MAPVKLEISSLDLAKQPLLNGSVATSRGPTPLIPPPQVVGSGRPTSRPPSEALAQRVVSDSLLLGQPKGLAVPRLAAAGVSR